MQNPIKSFPWVNRPRHNGRQPASLGTLKLLGRYGDERSAEALYEHYRIERELADRLRYAPREERQALYGAVYNELCQRVPAHPMLRAKASGSALLKRQRDVDHQISFLHRFIDWQTVFAEIGAGDCALALRMAEFSKQVYAIDVSEQIITNVRLPGNFRLILSDGCNIPLPDGSIDVAFSDQLMEHLHPDDALEQLQNIYRSLAPNGIYVCVTPNRLYGPRDISGYFEDVASGFHLREYSARELRQQLLAVGFRKVRFYAGARGWFVRCPFSVIALAETLLEALPTRVRRRLADMAPMRALLGLRIAAVKSAAAADPEKAPT
jgi:SAM-dependent methyltransferase